MSVNKFTHTSLIDPSQELHEIRSHRAPRKPRRYGIVVAAVLACAALLPLSASVAPTARAEATGTVTAVSVSTLPARGSVVSRSMVRKVAVTTRTQRINKVINYALAQRGDRYRFGATGPSAWDCSGLAKGAYKQIGITLPHYTGAMLKRGKHIAHKNLRRGDLVFPSSHHVGIYIGNGNMIVASSGHGRVMVQHVYAFYAARRII